MKIRLDFVTNSSSSSFIIGKSDDTTVTVETVFQKMKEFYNEYIEILKKATKQIENTKAFVLTADGYYKPKDGAPIYAEPIKSFNKKLEETYGIDLYSPFDYKRHSWAENCKSYEEYLKSFTNKEEIPFLITDNTVRDFNYDEYGVHEGVGWYCGCLEEMLSGEFKDCKTCEWKCDLYGEKAQLLREKLKINPTYQEAAIFLGKICISSECGKIPNYIVEKLYNISNYACNHMG